MRRRAFIAGIGASAAWPSVVRAQGERMRRVAILMPYSAADIEFKSRVQEFRQELQKLGWLEGRNVQFDERWTTDDMDLVRANAAGVLELKPDAVLAIGGRVIPILKQMTQSVPIIMPGSPDPVGTGLVESLAHPGGNITGFSNFELSIVGKQLEILKEVAPVISRVTLIYNPDNPSTGLFIRSFEDVAPSIAIQPTVAPIHGLADIDHAIENAAKQQGTGVYFPPDVTITSLRQQVVALVAQRRLPAIYSNRELVVAGGLMSYAADRMDIFRRAASYVDRVLRGEKPGDLPVQQPNKYELVVNLRAAKALGLVIPQGLLVAANEVIE
jgi:putative ABC transport system substrate-binding protein